LRGTTFDGLRTTGDFALTLNNSISYNPANYDYSGDLYLNATGGSLTYESDSDFDGNLYLIARDAVNLSTSQHVTGNLLIDSGGALSLSNNYSADGDVSLYADSLTTNTSGWIAAGSTLTINVLNDIVNSGSISGDVVNITTGGDFTSSENSLILVGDSEVANDFVINAGRAIITQGYAAIEGSAELNAGTHFVSQENSALLVGEDLVVNAQTYINNYGELSAFNNIDLTAATDQFDNFGDISARANITVDAGTGLTNFGVIDASGDVDLTAGENFYNSFNTDTGFVLAGGNLDITATGYIQNNNVIAAEGYSTLASGTSFINLSEGVVSFGDDSTVKTG